MLPLHIRAQDWREKEARKWGTERVSVDRVDEYLSGCERDGNNIGSWLAKQNTARNKISFCAASIGFAEDQVAEPGDERPPWRAGALEMMRDAQAGRRGIWVPIESVIASITLPPHRGAVVVYRRGSPSSGLGHVETIMTANENGYRSTGANERGGRWHADAKLVSYEHPNLLGFVVGTDAQQGASVPEVLTAELEIVDEESLEDILGGRQFMLGPDWEAHDDAVKAEVLSGE